MGVRTRPIFMNFSGGEISPKMEGRIDLDRYYSGAYEMKNWTCLKQGGAETGPGTWMIAAQGDETKKARMVPFVYSALQPYMLEFGHQYIRFFTNQGQVTSIASTHSLLLHCDGTESSTTFEDSGFYGHTVTPWGNTRISTSEKAFGTGSAYFDGTGDYLTVGDHASFDLSGEACTIDFRLYAKAYAGTVYFQQTDANNWVKISTYSIWTGSPPFLVGVKLQFRIAGTTHDIVLGYDTLNPPHINEWHHWEITQNGDDFRLFQDGALCNYNSTVLRMADYTGDVYIGSTAAPSDYLDGYLDEFRVLKGSCANTSSFSPPTGAYSGGTSPYEVVTTYTEADLPQLRFVESDFELYIFHPDHKPAILSKGAGVTWTLTSMTFIDGPYEDEINTPTITPSAVTGNITLTASSDLFLPGHVGALWRIKHTAVYGYVIITAVTNPTSADATVLSDLDGFGTACLAHCEGIWSDVNGWPKFGCFHEGRLLYGGNYEWPQTIWGSKSGRNNYNFFTPGTEYDDAYSFTMADLRVLRWAVSSRLLVAGAYNGEATATGPNDEPISSTAPPRIRPDSSIGSADAASSKIGRAILFLQRAGKKIVELIYRYDSDSYEANDLTVLAEHLTEDGIFYFDVQKEPTSIIWVVRKDGVLVGCTYDASQKVVGWHSHPTDGSVESVGVLPCDESDEVWMTVMRTVNGSTRRFVEMADDSILVHCGLSYSGSPITTVTGLDHLEGKEVAVAGDGAAYDRQTVVGGQIVIDPAASEITVGLPVDNSLITVRPEAQLQGGGTSQGLRKRWNSIMIRVLETMGLEVNGQTIPSRTVGDSMDAAPAPLTGDVMVENLEWDTDGRIEITQPLPLPAYVVCVMGQLVVGDV